MRILWGVSRWFLSSWDRIRSDLGLKPVPTKTHLINASAGSETRRVARRGRITSKWPTIRPELTGRFPERRLGLHSSQLGLERADRGLSKGLYFAGALGARQELRHVLVLGGVVRPSFRSGVPAIISNRHIDAVVNEKLRCIIGPADGAFVQEERK